MYYGYSIISGKERPNYIRGGEYNGLNSRTEIASSETGNFMLIRIHSELERILEIDEMLMAANEEYISLSRSIIDASDAVRAYVQIRISELRASLDALELERKQLLAEAS